MTKRKSPVWIGYGIWCNCPECRVYYESPDGGILDCYYGSLVDARKALKKETKCHHSSCYLVKETVERLVPIPHRKPKRKAA